MKVSKKLLAVAILAAAASGAAEARILSPADTDARGSELLFNLVNYTKQVSYTLDLGLTTEDFRANASGPYSFNVNNANMLSFLSTYAATDNVRWGVYGGHQLLNEEADTQKFGLYLTSAEGPAPARFDINAADISNSQGVINELITFIQTNDAYEVNNSTFRTIGQPGYTAGYGNDLRTAVPFRIQGSVGESLAFVQQKVNDLDFDTGEIRAFPGQWTFDISGQSASLIYEAPAAIPLPAAVWMFGAGVMGMLRMGRRQSKAI